MDDRNRQIYSVRRKSGQFVKKSHKARQLNVDPTDRPTPEDIRQPSTEDGWKKGRRIVDLHHLASELKRGCEKCHTPLLLHNIEKEYRKGFGTSVKKYFH